MGTKIVSVGVIPGLEVEGITGVEHIALVALSGLGLGLRLGLGLGTRVRVRVRARVKG